VPGEAPTVFRSGFKTIIDVDFDVDGNLYVLQHSSGPAGLAGPGSLIRVAPDGSRSTVLDNLTAPTSTAVARDGTIYVTNFGTTAGQGQVLRVVLPEPDAAAGFAGPPVTPDVWGTRNVEDRGILDGVTDVLS
jgi:hypothetical protein